MLAHVKRFFAPPVFEDEEKTRLAALVNTIAVTAVVLSAAAGVTFPLLDRTPGFELVINVIFVLLGLSTRFLVHRGRVRPAGILFLTTIWSITTLTSVFFGGVNSPTFGSYALVLIAAGLIFGEWGWRDLCRVKHTRGGRNAHSRNKRGLVPIFFLSRTCYYLGLTKYVLCYYRGVTWPHYPQHQ